MVVKETEKIPEIKRVEKYLRSRYEFVHNVVTDSNDFRKMGTDKFEPVNEDSLNRELQHMGIHFPLSEIKSLLRSNFVPLYDPIKAKFESLDPWDGTTDYIGMMAGYLETDNDEYWATMFKKMLVRTIAGALDKIPNRIVIVFVGKQECGKSWFIRNLNPFSDGLYYTEAPLRDDKDSSVRCSENLLYNLEELGVLSSWDLQKLKATISAGPIKERRPYEARERVFPRRCTFIASTNKDFFLTDEENSRWVCIRITDIDWGYKEAVDVNKMWAQAYHLYKTGFNYNLNEEEKKIRDTTNRDYELPYPERDYLLQFCKRAARKEDGAQFMSVIQIRDYLQELSENKKELNLFNLGKALKELGYVKDRQFIGNKRVTGYWINKLNGEVQYTDAPVEKLRVLVKEDNTPLPTVNEDGMTEYGSFFQFQRPE
jgi:predicted P-loop ATPase